MITNIERTGKSLFSQALKGLHKKDNTTNGTKFLFTTNHVIPLNKGILLLGPAESGKSRLMNLYVEGRNYVKLDCHGFKINKMSPFLFSDCRKDTQVVIFDDLPEKLILSAFDFVTNGILVQKKGEASFFIYPKIIITSNCLMKDVNTGTSAKKRFDIFELSGCI